MKQKHYYYFGQDMTEKFTGDNSLNVENWDVLRNDEADGPFSIEKTVRSYEQNCVKSKSYENVAKAIVDEIKSRGWTERRLVSCGVGKGILEWHIKRLCPDLYVECTDYTREAIEKLKKVFPGMDCGHTFDMLNGDYSVLGRDSVIVMYRVSTEFSREQWDDIFKKMYDDGIKNIIYIPAGLDTPITMLREKWSHLKNRLLGRKDTFCGWLYSEDEFLSMYKGGESKPLYRILKKTKVENTAMYCLERDS